MEVADNVEDKLPVIDFRRLFDPENSEQESSKLHLACQQWGFFQLINHGIPAELLTDLEADCLQFFKLPVEEKRKYTPKEIKTFQGYYRYSDEKTTGLNYGEKLIIANMTFWPRKPQTFSDVLEKYALAVNKLARSLLQVMLQNLGVEPEMFFRKFTELSGSSVRIGLYPPYKKSDDDIETQGLFAHSDVSILTLLLQVNDVDGLQVRKNGRWFPARPMPGAFLVNIGDVLEIFSNGKYKSIEHRVVINSEKERLSIASFCYPDNEAVIGPLPELARGDEHRYKTLKFVDYFNSFMYTGARIGKQQLEAIRI